MRGLKQVKAIPKGQSSALELLQEFLDTGWHYAVVHPSYRRASLRVIVANENLPIKVRVHMGGTYLERLDP